MKKTPILIILLAMVFTSCSNKAWEEAKTEDSIESYQSFIEQNPESEHIIYATKMRDSLILVEDAADWLMAEELNTDKSYDKYISKHPKGVSIESAYKKKE